MPKTYIVPPNTEAFLTSYPLRETVTVITTGKLNVFSEADVLFTQTHVVESYARQNGFTPFMPEIHRPYFKGEEEYLGRGAFFGFKKGNHALIVKGADVKYVETS